jgi:hypothetical protein
MADGRGKSPNTPRWKPGVSGNPSGKNGAKNFSSLTQALRKIGFEIDPDDKSKSGANYYETAARCYWWNAVHGFNGQGSHKAIEAIASRLDGKPVETVQLNATVTQRSPEEHAQEILQTLQRLKQHEDSGDTTIN